jgi:DNA-binding transcriptional LysR family regulator
MTPDSLSSARDFAGKTETAHASGLRLADLNTFLVVQRLGSVTASARQLDVTPSQVSKAVARLEAHLRCTLLTRSSRGVALTVAGGRLLPRLDDLSTRLRSLRRDDASDGSLLTVSAPSYINAYVLPAIARAVPEMRVRALEMPPSLVRTFASANCFDATVLIGTTRLPETWAVSEIGTCRKTAFASPSLARRLGPQPVPVDRLRDFSFVSPVYNLSGQFVPVDDDCPLPVGMRRAGHEVQTIGLALELAAQTEQIVYGPAFAALHEVQRGAVTEVQVRGWNMSDPVYLACNVDRVLARQQTALVRALRVAFAELEQQSSRKAFAALGRKLGETSNRAGPSAP